MKESGLRVAAIVPTFDEAENLGSCIERLRRSGVASVTVVDGGSRDGTVDLARRLADEVLEERGGGLFAQLNAGARRVAADVILFQYGDGLFPERGVRAIEAALADPRAVGGAFRLGFASSCPVFRLVAGGANLRNALGFGPFGDQSIFARREVFLELGGFDPAQLLPDYELVRKLRKRGKFCLAGERLEVSVRRWKERGFVRTLLGHWKLSGAYLLGARRADGALGREIEVLRRVR